MFGYEAAMKLVPSALFRVLLPGFVLFSSAVNAADELVVYVFSNGTPVAGAEITVDGDVVGRTRSDGSITADLSSGGRS